MLKPSQYENELIGSIEDLNISDILPPDDSLRSGSKNVSELTDSIGKVGLLSPILVRVSGEGKFELIAGNRRFKACKSLGWRKIPCHVVELDKKGSFEAALIENIQRNSLTIIEEGLAFRKYINEFGWGAATELALKLSKSSSYISKRMRLLDLPEDVLNLLYESEISASTGEELLSIKERDKQAKFAKLAADKSMSSKKLRILIKESKSEAIDLPSISLIDEQEKFIKTFDKSILVLRIAMNNLGTLIEKIEDNWILYDVLRSHRNIVNLQIDLLIRQKKKYVNKKHFFALNA
jgi:ParB family chromosome partitioning protein